MIGFPNARSDKDQSHLIYIANKLKLSGKHANGSRMLLNLTQLSPSVGLSFRNGLNKGMSSGKYNFQNCDFSPDLKG